MSHQSVFHSSVTQFPQGFQLPVKVFDWLPKWEWDLCGTDTINRVVDINFAWRCKTELTFWWGCMEVNISVKTMTDTAVKYKFTVAFSMSSNCQQHQWVSGELSAKMRGENEAEGRKQQSLLRKKRICLGARLDRLVQRPDGAAHQWNKSYFYEEGNTTLG